MSPSPEDIERAVENGGGLGMRLPLELVEMVIEAVAASSEQSELTYLRLVSSESQGPEYS